jgi:hypothetical protein
MLFNLLTTLNNVGSKTLFSPVFINPEQVDHFLPCTAYGASTYDDAKIDIDTPK